MLHALFASEKGWKKDRSHRLTGLPFGSEQNDLQQHHLNHAAGTDAYHGT